MGKITKLLENIEDSKIGFRKTETNKSFKSEVDLSLPEIKLGDIDPKFVVYHDPESFSAENFKILRSQILHPRTGLPSRFILVTSAVPQEGKTYIAINLAFSFARSVPTILIETDLRRPSFTHFLGINPEKGLADYLLKKCALSDIVLKTDYDNLFLVSSGSNYKDIKDVFSSEKMVNFLEDLRRTFSGFFFIFDSAPLMVASETISLSRLVDGVLFVVRYAFSDRDIVGEALEKIGRSKLLGFVFNSYSPSVLGLFSPKLKHVKYIYQNH